MGSDNPMSVNASSDLLGLFPCFSSSTVGGIELSGRLAWEGIERDSERARLFMYGPDATGWNPDSTHVVAASKAQAAWRAARERWQASTVLVWHVGLLKLLPFFRLRNARVLLFLHGIEIWRPLDPLTRLLLGQVDTFLSNSDFTWQRCLEFHPSLAARPHRTVHLGLGTPLPSAPPPPDDPPAALVVSRLARDEDYKGHRELIQAWPRVLERLPTAQLWIAGEGDLRPILEQQVEHLGLSSQVHFLGRISEAEKETRLQRCRCLAMPSRGEGFGLVYLEAMRQGRPCLVSTLDAGREVVNPPEAGLAADPANVDAIWLTRLSGSLPLGRRGNSGHGRHGSAIKRTLLRVASNQG